MCKIVGFVVHYTLMDFNVEYSREKIDARTITVKCSLETNVEGAPGKLSLFTT